MATAATEHQLGRDLKKTKRDKKRANAINQPAGSTSRDSSSSPSSPEQNNDDLINFGGHSWGTQNDGNESGDSDANPDYHTGRYDDKAMGGGEQQPAEENQSGDGEPQNDSSTNSSDAPNDTQNPQTPSDNEKLTPEQQQGAAGSLRQQTNAAKGNQKNSDNQKQEDEDKQDDNPLSAADNVMDNIASSSRARNWATFLAGPETTLPWLWAWIVLHYYLIGDFCSWVRLKFGTGLFTLAMPGISNALAQAKDETSKKAYNAGVAFFKIISYIVLFGFDIIVLVFIGIIIMLLFILVTCEGQSMAAGAYSGSETVGNIFGVISNMTGHCFSLTK